MVDVKFAPLQFHCEGQFMETSLLHLRKTMIHKNLLRPCRNLVEEVAFFSIVDVKFRFMVNIMVHRVSEKMEALKEQKDAP